MSRGACAGGFGVSGCSSSAPPRALSAIARLGFAIVALVCLTGPSVLTLDADFRESMHHYAVVERADGRLYDLYINEVGLEGWRSGRTLVPGTAFAIESFDMRPPAEPGEAAGREAAHHDVHVSMKSTDWAESGPISTVARLFGEPTGPATWRMAGFDPRDGSPTPGLDIPECHACHLDHRAEDFILSRGLLDGFVRTGEPSRIVFRCGEREICFGTPRD